MPQERPSANLNHRLKPLTEEDRGSRRRCLAGRCLRSAGKDQIYCKVHQGHASSSVANKDAAPSRHKEHTQSLSHNHPKDRRDSVPPAQRRSFKASSNEEEDKHTLTLPSETGEEGLQSSGERHTHTLSTLATEIQTHSLEATDASLPLVSDEDETQHVLETVFEILQRQEHTRLEDHRVNTAAKGSKKQETMQNG